MERGRTSLRPFTLARVRWHPRVAALHMFALVWGARAFVTLLGFSAAGIMRTKEKKRKKDAERERTLFALSVHSCVGCTHAGLSMSQLGRAGSRSFALGCSRGLPGSTAVRFCSVASP